MREFNLWTILQGTQTRVATFHAETCVMSHQSLLNLLHSANDLDSLIPPNLINFVCVCVHVYIGVCVCVST